ncbi:MAG TPA: hypothetical protein V6C89_11260 [Drouetiella sp.]
MANPSNELGKQICEKRAQAQTTDVLNTIALSNQIYDLMVADLNQSSENRKSLLPENMSAMKLHDPKTREDLYTAAFNCPYGEVDLKYGPHGVLNKISITDQK